MTFFIYVLAVLTGLGIYEVCIFALKAYRRYRYNQEKKKYLYTLRRAAELGNILSLLEMKRRKSRMN